MTSPPPSPVLSFKRAQFLDFLLKILPPEFFPHEKESDSPYCENQEERESIPQWVRWGVPCAGSHPSHHHAQQ